MYGNAGIRAGDRSRTPSWPSAERQECSSCIARTTRGRHGDRAGCRVRPAVGPAPAARTSRRRTAWPIDPPRNANPSWQSTQGHALDGSAFARPNQWRRRGPSPTSASLEALGVRAGRSVERERDPPNGRSSANCRKLPGSAELLHAAPPRRPGKWWAAHGALRAARPRKLRPRDKCDLHSGTGVGVGAFRAGRRLLRAPPSRAPPRSGCFGAPRDSATGVPPPAP